MTAPVIGVILTVATFIGRRRTAQGRQRGGFSVRRCGNETILNSMDDATSGNALSVSPSGAAQCMDGKSCHTFRGDRGAPGSPAKCSSISSTPCDEQCQDSVADPQVISRLPIRFRLSTAKWWVDRGSAMSGVEIPGPLLTVSILPKLSTHRFLQMRPTGSRLTIAPPCPNRLLRQRGLQSGTEVISLVGGVTWRRESIETLSFNCAEASGHSGMPGSRIRAPRGSCFGGRRAENGARWRATPERSAARTATLLIPPRVRKAAVARAGFPCGP